MTEAEIMTRLISLAKDAKEGDVETAHADADCLLCAFLEALGYSNIADAFSRIQPKWYA